MSKNGNSPAYPKAGRCYECEGSGMNYGQSHECGVCGGLRHTHEGGMTKREAMAMVAMQGLQSQEAGKECEDLVSEDHLAAMAVHQADALLAELAKEQP